MPTVRPPRKTRPEIPLRQRALKLLALRDHSRRELARKLARYSEDQDEIARVLDDFERRGWLSEKRLVESYTAAKRARFGARRIEFDLRAKGVSDAAIAGVSSALKAGDLGAAREVWRKKFSALPADARERARQTRFLLGRGFGADVIRRVLKLGAGDDAYDDDLS